MEVKHKYNRGEILVSAIWGYVAGMIGGTLEGYFLSLAVPSSARQINDELDSDIESIIKNENAYKAIENMAYHGVRLVTRISIHATAMQRMTEDILNGGDIIVNRISFKTLLRFTKQQSAL